MIPVVAWTVSKDFNGRMWLAKVPSLPSSADLAYQQWTDDGSGTLKPGEPFTTVEQGIDAVLKDQAEANQASAPSQAQAQQQQSTAQQMEAKYGTPEGQAALRAMSPAQLMALAQQMQPQTMKPRIVSPHDQELLQKIGDGVYSGQKEVMAEAMEQQKQINTIEEQWDKDVAALGPRQQAETQKLPVCPGEAGIPSSQSMAELELKYADERIALATKYLPQFTPVIEKVRVAVGPEIDFGDDALAAWSGIEDAGLKQQVSAQAQGAEQQGLGQVTLVESMVKGVSGKAAQTVADKKAIQKKYANAHGC
jgi:hypothetical protein